MDLPSSLDLPAENEKYREIAANGVGIK